MQSAGPEIDDSFDFLFKIILVGDSNVGKTCVVQSFKSGIFVEKQQNTIGVDFSVRTLDIDGKKVKVGHTYIIIYFISWINLVLSPSHIHMPSADCFSTSLTKKACLCNTVVYLLWGLACSTYCYGERGVCEQLLELCLFSGCVDALTACVLERTKPGSTHSKW